MARRPTEPTANPARGAALVVAAVLIGLFLLRNGLDTSATVAPDTDGGSITETDGSDDGETDTATDEGTTDTVPVREPAEVPTIVLNGSSVSGAAKKYSDALATRGYQLPNPAGGNATQQVTATQVLFAPGFDREAAAVAAAIGAPTIVPEPLGTTQPGVISGAVVVVVLGPDIAGNTPPSV